MSTKKFQENNWRFNPEFKALCRAFLSCKTENEMANFLRDIGTLPELKEWSDRLEIAKQLTKKRSYFDIAEDLGVSTTTITRVARFLENGTGGYGNILNTNKHHGIFSHRERSVSMRHKSN